MMPDLEWGIRSGAKQSTKSHRTSQISLLGKAKISVFESPGPHILGLVELNIEIQVGGSQHQDVEFGGNRSEGEKE